MKQIQTAVHLYRDKYRALPESLDQLRQNLPEVSSVPKEHQGAPYEYRLSPDKKEYVLRVSLGCYYYGLPSGSLSGIVLGLNCNDNHYCLSGSIER
jgi:hypothetical protein